MTKIETQRLVIVNSIDDYFQMRLFEPCDNHWYELLCFSLDSLIFQAKIIYSINLNEYLN